MKRYMIFVWDEYDNVAPFDCMTLSYDGIDEAIKAKGRLERDEFEGEKVNYGVCLFDRVEGVFK